MIRLEDCYIHLNTSINIAEFKLAFELSAIDVNVDASSNPLVYILRIWNSKYSVSAALWVREIGASTTTFTLVLYSFGLGTDTSISLNVGQTYYLSVNISRLTNTLTCEIYSDAARTNLVDTLTRTVGDAYFPYDRLYATMSFNRPDDPSDQSDGYVEDLNINIKGMGLGGSRRIGLLIQGR